MNTEDAAQLRNYKQALDEHSIVAVTDRRGRITYANDKFCNMSGYTLPELLGQTHALLNSNHHDRSFFQELWSTIASGHSWHGDIRNKTKAGKFYWVKTTITPFKDARGVIREYVSIRTDITDQIEMKQKLSQTNARLKESSDRLKAEHLALNRKNIALNELITHIEDEKDKIRLDMKFHLETILFPLIEQTQLHLQGVEQKYVELIAQNLQNLTETIVQQARSLGGTLTPKELQICNMIKNGMSMKEIASFLNLSPRTVGKHRENVRKKLKLVDKKINLTTYLMEHLS